MGVFYMQFGKPSDKDSEIRGSCQDVKHPGWIELMFISLGRHTTTHASRGEREAKPEEPHEVSTGTGDVQALNRLFLACANGTIFDKVTIAVRQMAATAERVALLMIMTVCSGFWVPDVEQALAA